MRSVLMTLACILAALLTANVAAASPSADLRVTALMMQHQGAGVSFRLLATQVPIFTSFQLSGPDRLVVELPHARLVPGVEPPPGSHPLVSRVTLEEVAAPRELVRVVLFLSALVDYEMNLEGTTLVMTLLPLPATAPPDTPVLAQLAPESRRAEEAERARLAEEQRRAEEAEQARLAEETRRAEEAERARIAEEQRRAEEAERARREAEKVRSLPVRTLAPGEPKAPLPPTGPALVKRIGFVSEGQTGVVRLALSHAVTVAYAWEDSQTLILRFSPAYVANRMNLLPLYTQAFGTPVMAIRPDLDPKQHVFILRITLKRHGRFTVTQTDGQVDIRFE